MKKCGTCGINWGEGRPIPPEDRWNGEHGHLYDMFHKCSRCRFYASDAAVVAEHEKACSGAVVMPYFCWGCRFDAQNMDELRGHYGRGDCVDEIGHITAPIYMMNFDVLDHDLVP